jgi:hypothetical protein
MELHYRIFSPLHPGVGLGIGTADRLQDLTHKMCYLFGQATKAVSVCPPAYYADLVCTRARCYMSDLFDPTPSATPTGSVAGEVVVVYPRRARQLFTPASRIPCSSTIK